MYYIYFDHRVFFEVRNLMLFRIAEIIQSQSVCRDWIEYHERLKDKHVEYLPAVNISCYKYDCNNTCFFCETLSSHY